MSKFDFAISSSSDADAFIKEQQKYKNLKRDDLPKLAESGIVGAVTAWIECGFREDWSDMNDKLNALPTPCLNIYCANIVQNQIVSGGFSEAVFNLSNDFLGIASTCFKVIGYEKISQIIDSAVGKAVGKKPSGRTFEDFLEFCESTDFGDCDRDFKRCYEKSKFDKLAKEYIISYAKYFGEDT